MTVRPGPIGDRVIAGGFAAISLGCALLDNLRAAQYDDAFITYVFARNLAAGHGITWVAGDPPLYGPTSLLYTLLLAGAHRLGLDLPLAGALLGHIGWATAHGCLFLLLKRRTSLAVAAGGTLLSALSVLAVRVSGGMESGLYVAIVFSALLALESGRYRLAGVAAALGIFTRPDGLLVLALFLAHQLRSGACQSARDRLIGLVHAAAPAAALLAVIWAWEFAYFGTVVPESVKAKALFGCDISGCFSPSGYVDLLASHFGGLWTTVLIVIAAVGLARTIISGGWTEHTLFVWGLLYLTVFTVGRAPDSPWYYAPLIPITFAAFASGLEGGARVARGTRVLKLGSSPALVAVVAIGAWYSVVEIWNHRGSHPATVEWEKAQLANALLADMDQGGLRSASVIAFEVGYVGYVIPGRVYDLLGLVTPGFQPCLKREDADQALVRLHPDYVLVLDNDQYRGTGCVRRSMELARRFEPIVRVRRPWGDDYVIFRRHPETGRAW